MGGGGGRGAMQRPLVRSLYREQAMNLFPSILQRSFMGSSNAILSRRSEVLGHKRHFVKLMDLIKGNALKDL